MQCTGIRRDCPRSIGAITLDLRNIRTVSCESTTHAVDRVGSAAGSQSQNRLELDHLRSVLPARVCSWPRLSKSQRKKLILVFHDLSLGTDSCFNAWRMDLLLLGPGIVRPCSGADCDNSVVLLSQYSCMGSNHHAGHRSRNIRRCSVICVLAMAENAELDHSVDRWCHSRAGRTFKIDVDHTVLNLAFRLVVLEPSSKLTHFPASVRTATDNDYSHRTMRFEPRLPIRRYLPAIGRSQVHQQYTRRAKCTQLTRKSLSRHRSGHDSRPCSERLSEWHRRSKI